MPLTHAFTNAAATDGPATSLATAAFDSTGYDYLVAWCKHEGAAATITVADNKSSTLAGLTKESHSNNDLHGQLFWGAIGTPGTGHTATMSVSASRGFLEVAAWLIDSAGAVVELDVQSPGQGSSTAPDAGSLVTTAAAILIMGVGGYTTQTYTPGTGWTEDSEANNNFKGSRNEAASGTFDPACTATGNAAWVALSAAFKESGGAATAGRLVNGCLLSGLLFGSLA